VGGQGALVPEEVALGEEPGSIMPGDLAELFKLLVVSGHIGVAIIADGSVIHIFSL
jgi:hypothetical protein